MEKGGGNIENTVLFGKYQLCRVLGRGRSGTVYLARHMELDEYRAIKRVSKSHTGYEQFRKEALILKTLRHPGIPIVYDLEEDEQYSYLIEEFLEGDSLYALISETGQFSKAMTVSYGIQICRLVYSLHFCKPTPILYLDLQPKNLLLCRQAIKLVDFDHAIPAKEAKLLKQHYGTAGCAAPEQYRGEIPDERTDIYAIGAVLYYMLTGEYPQPPFRGRVPGAGKDLSAVIRKCLNQKKEDRYRSAGELMERLEQIRDSEQGVFKNDQESSLTVAVSGAGPGVGATHLAIGLAVFLSRQGLRVLYEEWNASGAVRQLASCFNAGMDEYGIYWVYGQPMMMRYGDAVKLKPHPYRIVVRDYGVAWQEIREGEVQAVVMVLSGKPWQWESDRRACSLTDRYEEAVVVINRGCRPFKTRLPKPKNPVSIFLMPYFFDPFHQDKGVKQFYRSLWNQFFGKERNKRNQSKRNIVSRIFKP